MIDTKAIRERCEANIKEAWADSGFDMLKSDYYALISKLEKFQDTNYALENSLTNAEMNLEHLLAEVDRLTKENDKYYYTLLGVMHSVDKWLDGDELKQDEVNRASTMREKTLQIVEMLEEKRDKAIKLLTPLSDGSRAVEKARLILIKGLEAHHETV